MEQLPQSIIQNLVCTTSTAVFLKKKATRNDETEMANKWISLPQLIDFYKI